MHKLTQGKPYVARIHVLRNLTRKNLYTGSPPLVRFLIVRISNQYGFSKTKNSTIFLVSTVFSTNLENFWKFLMKKIRFFLFMVFFQIFVILFQLLCVEYLYVFYLEFVIFNDSEDIEFQKHSRHTKNLFQYYFFTKKRGLLIS